MSLPAKASLTKTLRNFAKELTAITKTYSRTEAVRTSVEEVRGIAHRANEVADSIDATDEPYVHPTTAQTLVSFADDVNTIADASTDQLYQASLKVASGALRTFMFRHTPVMTEEGVRFK
jgi:hypothetical protein